MTVQRPAILVQSPCESGGDLRLVIPSDGELGEPTMRFLDSCGVKVSRPNSRRYTGSIPAIPGIDVLFQRTADITNKVEEGSADMGITGLDRLMEYRHDDDAVVAVMDDLEFGRCDYVLAVPESWLDVTSIDDLADLALEFHAHGHQLRIATKYPRLLRRYLFERGINHFSLVAVSGTLEAAPIAGYADLIADLSATGTTLRENRLKTVDGGTILSSQACLIANPITLADSPDDLRLAQSFTEMLEAHLRAEPYYRITANVQGRSAEDVSTMILARPDIAGIQGPTVARVFSVEEEDWYAVSLLIRKNRLLDVVEHLRECGGVDIAAAQLSYLFKGESQAFDQFMGRIAARNGGPAKHA